MIGRIPIYDGKVNVGMVVWSGTLAGGDWVFRHSKVVDDELVRARNRHRVLGARDARPDLRALFFRGPDGREYRGWGGFPGVVGAFELALPGFGLRVERSAVRWPYKDTADDPLGQDFTGSEALRISHIEGREAYDANVYLRNRETH